MMEIQQRLNVHIPSFPLPSVSSPKRFNYFICSPFPSVNPNNVLNRRARTVAQARSGNEQAPPRPSKGLWELKEGGDEEGKGAQRRTFSSEAEAKRHHWISRMWAPWEEALSPEAQFAVEALNLGQGDEPIVPIEMMDRLKVNEPVVPDPVEGEPEIPENHDVAEAIANGAIPGTAWKTPMAFSLVPPRDWPPPGWKVDPDELAFIRGIHKFVDTRVTPFNYSSPVTITDENPGNFARWNMFLKQYDEWVAANKDKLDREAEEVGDEYYPGRRRMGKEYVDGMYELPFVYPGQHYLGIVTMVHLYEGAFVNFGAVHDGWVPIKRNDWYWLRNKIKVGMKVQVEVIAKRDPYRFRFPVELRFVNPNVDHLIFNRFKHPPIFVRDGEENNMDLITREVGRPFWPRRRPDPEEGEEEVPKYNHPFSFKVWQLHVAEQMVLDDEERRAAGIATTPQELKEVDPNDRDYIDAEWFWTEEKIGGEIYDSLVLEQHESELNMDAARRERKSVNKARQEAQRKGEPFQEPKPWRITYMEQLDVMHWQRYLDEHEAYLRDKVNRLEFGMPLEEPGKYADDSFFGENKYNPREKRWRSDYIGDVSKSKSEKKERAPRPVEDEEKSNPSSGSTGKASKGKDAPGWSSNESTEIEMGSKKNTDDDKVVNGTESSTIPDVKSPFKLMDDEMPEDD